jgi:integrase
MPLKLVDPRPGKTPYYSVRGTYLGIYVDRTTKTAERRKAKAVIEKWKREIERGQYAAAKPVIAEAPGEPTFADATLAYLKANGDPTYLRAIIDQNGIYALRDKPLRDIDQAAIDNAADALYPNSPPTTKNRQFYTPVSAVLKRAGVERKIKRPKGWRGSKATSWLEPEQAFDVVDEAYGIDPEFGLFCLTLLYTGMRLSDPVKARMRNLKLDQALLYIPDTKNGEPRPVHLPPVLVQAFLNQPPRPMRPRKADGKPLASGTAGRSRRDAGIPFLDRSGDEKLFRFAIGGRLRTMLQLAIKRAGLSFPRRQGGFHLFCHTYGTWMTRYGSLDTYGLVRTGRWKSAESADRYNHTIASPEARRADLMPVKKGKSN